MSRAHRVNSRALDSYGFLGLKDLLIIIFILFFSNFKYDSFKSPILKGRKKKKKKKDKKEEK